jgi:hypothetical protein
MCLGQLDGMPYQSTFLTDFGNGTSETCLAPPSSPPAEEPKPQRKNPYLDAHVPIFKCVREHLGGRWPDGVSVLWSPARVAWPEAPDHIVVFVDEAHDLYSDDKRALEELYGLLDDRRYGYGRAKHGIMCDGERRFQTALKDADVPLHVLGKERWNITYAPFIQADLYSISPEGLQQLYAAYAANRQLFDTAAQMREGIKKFRYTPKQKLPTNQSRLVRENPQKRVDETPRHFRGERRFDRILSRNDLLFQAGTMEIVGELKPSSEFFQTYLARRRRQLYIYHCEHTLRGDNSTPLLCVFPVIPSRAELGGMEELAASVGRPIGSVTVANRHRFGRAVKAASEDLKSTPDSDARESELHMLDFYARLAQ